MINQLHSTILGEGAPLIILHGFLGMSDNWKTLGLKYAEQGLQVHLVDQRNHGRSFHSDEFDYDILATDLFNYLDQHRIKKPIVLGHSMGGKTATQFAMLHPNRVHKLIVADIAPKYYPPHHHYILNGLQQLDFDLIKSRSEADLTLAKYINEIGIRQFLLKNLYWIEKGKLAFRFNLPVLSQKMEEIGESISSIDLFNGPTLFLRGDKSEYITPQDKDLILRHFPSAAIETIENAGHWLHSENPLQFFAKSMAFINMQ